MGENSSCTAFRGAVNLQVSWREEGVERVAANARTGKNG